MVSAGFVFGLALAAIAGRSEGLFVFGQDRFASRDPITRAGGLYQQAKENEENFHVSCTNEATKNQKSKQTQEWDVERYQSQHSFVWEYGSSLAELIDIQPDERVLDVGCGSGELTHELAMKQPLATVMGMDLDPGMVEKAKRQFPFHEFFQGDVCNLQLGEPVDVIFSNAALHWVADAEHAVQAMSQALKPGGRFVVEFGGKGNVQLIHSAMRQIFPNWREIWYFPSIGEYSSLLEKHGIEVKEATLFDRPVALEDGPNGLRNWVKMFGDSFLQDLPEPERSDALDSIEEKLLPHLFDGERWTADYRRIRIFGQKVA